MAFKQSFRNRAALAALALPLALSFAAGCGSEKTAHSNLPEPGKPVSAPTAQVIEADTPDILEATGVAKAQFNSTLSAKVMGRVLAVNAKEGDAVKSGQLLVVVDSSDLSAAVDVSSANFKAALVGLENSRTASTMEAQMSVAKLEQARAQVQQAKAGLNAANARLQLAQAGPRSQEKAQAKLAVQQAAANLKLAQSELTRQKNLFESGATAKRQYEMAQNAYDVAKAQYDTAVQSEAIAIEGTRSQDMRAAEEAVRQAQASVNEAEAGYRQAQAGLLQAKLRKDDIKAASAQVSQTAAARKMAEVTRSYARIAAPFDGTVVARLADPGTSAAPGVPLMTIQGGPIRLEAIVPETALKTVKVGMKVPVVFDSAATKELEGKVVEMVPQGDASTHSFLVRVEVPRESGVLSGMYGRALFTTGSRKRILTPTSAIIERGGLHYVYTVNPETIIRLRFITIGQVFGNRTEVLSGLNAGETVLNGNLDQVTDGSKLSGNGRS